MVDGEVEVLEGEHDAFALAECPDLRQRVLGAAPHLIGHDLDRARPAGPAGRGRCRAG